VKGRGRFQGRYGNAKAADQPGDDANDWNMLPQGDKRRVDFGWKLTAKVMSFSKLFGALLSKLFGV
jgi:hypothetical protein